MMMEMMMEMTTKKAKGAIYEYGKRICRIPAYAPKPYYEEHIEV